MLCSIVRSNIVQLVNVHEYITAVFFQSTCLTVEECMEICEIRWSIFVSLFVWLLPFIIYY